MTLYCDFGPSGAMIRVASLGAPWRRVGQYVHFSNEKTLTLGAKYRAHSIIFSDGKGARWFKNRDRDITKNSSLTSEEEKEFLMQILSSKEW